MILTDKKKPNKLHTLKHLRSGRKFGRKFASGQPAGLEAKERGGGGGGQAAVQPRRGKRLDLDHVDFRQNEIEEVRNLIGVLESVVLISLKKLSDENFLNPITNFLYSILKSLAGGGITIPKPPPMRNTGSALKS